ncbi:endonuclease III [Marinigracilibium pacificum]|uniref:Endonuclease III n=1 Tax=Marinigracilibium pacificum TaxID=2729599 RepID=A0A848J282_9BACT|nr:endonuclease III [Marinigracilibium pacificum]NMM48419.1 endonuclease III [Marinigracilibium pacificum]
MTRKEKAKEILNILNNIYPEPPIPLDHKDAYTLLIAVLLSAQCTDERVNKVTPELFALADNPYDMVKLTVEQIKSIIRPCGLSPRKSKAIYDLSQILIDKYNGEVPDDMAKLEELPGVGHKTASVVMAQAFNVPAFPVDTHIHRLAWRWGLSTGKSVEKTEADLKKVFPPETWNKVHLQIIYYAREYSPARGYRFEKDIISQKYGRKSFTSKYIDK